MSMMNQNNRILILLYQYYLNKADNLQFDAKIVSDKIRRSKKITAFEFYEYQKVLLRHELFEELFDEFDRLTRYLGD